LHYDLMMFFDKERCNEAEAISRHMGECWKFITNDAGFYRLLNGKTITPYLSGRVDRHIKKTGEFPHESDFVGLVEQGTVQARNLLQVAKTMVFAVVLRKPSKATTLIKSTARRFGKSDLRTGCGYDKPGRGKKSGHSGVKHERKRRPKYVAPEFRVRLE